MPERRRLRELSLALLVSGEVGDEGRLLPPLLPPLLGGSSAPAASACSVVQQALKDSTGDTQTNSNWFCSPLMTQIRIFQLEALGAKLKLLQKFSSSQFLYLRTC